MRRALRSSRVRPNFRQVTTLLRAPNVRSTTMDEQSARRAIARRHRANGENLDFGRASQIHAPSWRNQENPMIPPRVSVDIVRERIGPYADKKASAEER